MPRLTFMKTADFVAAILCNSNLQSSSIHGDRLQSQREQALREFQNGIRNILVATSVAARGLNIAGINYFVSYDLPTDIEEYVLVERAAWEMLANQ
ncbi:probable ATP-dependent RNA helicase vasa-like [Daphnia carinata]|uniref:probable ATP-dependent RNA helicase vasa-like n=1 Tax=Daphnia carinata TaxID=120202 RepID=UPI00257EB3A5|nr:probable ATP-dependent RNA helicase vasa-like [Daphnia carinata]